MWIIFPHSRLTTTKFSIWALALELVGKWENKLQVEGFGKDGRYPILSCKNWELFWGGSACLSSVSWTHFIPKS